jgi:hypothetical protein
MDAHGKMTVLRPGTNDWVCIPGDEIIIGAADMCADPMGMRWNGRSAAAIRKLGARDLGVCQDHRFRRDGTRRRSRIFRLVRPGS